MSDSTNHSNSSATHASNRTGLQAITNLPANCPITSSTQPSPSASSIGPHTVNGGPLDGNDQAQRTTATDSNINSGLQTGDNVPNDQDDTPLSAMMTVEYTYNPAVRRLHEAFHTDEPHPRGPFTLATDLMRQMTARDRQEYGLPPDTSQPGMASHNHQSTDSEPDGFDLFDIPSSAIPPVAVTDTPITLAVSQDDDCSSSGAIQHGPLLANSSGILRVSQAADFTDSGYHASELPSYPLRLSAPPSERSAPSSHPREASDTVAMSDSNHPVNERSSNSNQRPSYSMAALGLRGEPVLDNGDTAGSHFLQLQYSCWCNCAGQPKHASGRCAFCQY
jgi:hypothetical protein